MVWGSISLPAKDNTRPLIYIYIISYHNLFINTAYSKIHGAIRTHMLCNMYLFTYNAILPMSKSKNLLNERFAYHNLIRCIIAENSTLQNRNLHEIKISFSNII